MKKLFITLLSLIMVAVLSCPSILCVSAAEETDAQIHSLIPKVEEYYTGVEDYIADCLRNKQDEIDVGRYFISTDNAPLVFKSAVFSNPDIFYVNASTINYKFNDSTGIVQYIVPVYIVAKSKIPAYEKKFNKAVSEFLDGIDTSMSDFRKVLLLHDKIITNCAYKMSGELSYTAYGVLVNKKAVCEGYCRAYCYLLSKLGVESKCINNESQAHCWNYVKIGDNWYNVDVTSDDPIPDICGYVNHGYFLISDSKLKSYKSVEHKGYKTDITYKSTYNCSSKDYDSSFFRDIKSEIICSNNSYYFINNNYKNKNFSTFIKRADNKNKVIKVITDSWYSKSGKRYLDSYCKLCYLDGFIYFNSKKEIYRYKISNSKLSRVFKMPSFWSKDFYGVKTNGRYITGEKKKSETSSPSSSNILQITSSNSVIQLPFINKTSVTIKVKKTYTMKVYRGTGKATYKSSSKKIATVDAKGKVTARKKGKCTITAYKSGRTFTLKVTVKK